MPGSTTVSELARLLGAAYVLAPGEIAPYDLDATRRPGVVGHAEAVALPGSAAEVADVVRWCYERDVPIVARGGGTGVVGGAIASEGGVVLSLERLRRVRELDAALWRMLPEAGVSTRDVQRLARENGLMFAPDPGASEQSQIGGNVATNAGGPHALKYGVTGNWVAGLEVVLAPGELVEIGGWASKDVAGYDLRSLLIGSEGTLGVITAVRLRLLPAPEQRLALVVFLATRAEGCDAIETLLASGLRPAVLDFLDGYTLSAMSGSYPGQLPAQGGDADGEGAGFALIVELDGSAADVRAQRAEVEDLLGDGAIAIDVPEEPTALWRWRDGVNGVLTAIRGVKVSEDVVFPRERLREGLERFESIAAGHDLQSCAFGHGGEGNVHATVLADPADDDELARAAAVAEELFGLVLELGGSIAGEHGVGLLKRGRLAQQWSEPAVALHEQIKRAFDPKGLLNPGKKVAR
ncbi:MAG TPA: FAD-linked oxidase C-terminal domain-containing protein [Solirubrobacteraceae bacterium]|nr:FAD-linked oxidase C-terminal domain-containing protein [Solirubrobacteraceae bacterium]